MMADQSDSQPEAQPARVQAERSHGRRGITEKQRQFAWHYVFNPDIIGNALACARQAGYKGNPKTLQVMGAENLSKPIVIAEIERLRAEKTARAERGVEWWERETNRLYEECAGKDALGKIKDATNAKGLLDMLARHYGSYEADNRQRAPKIGVFVT